MPTIQVVCCDDSENKNSCLKPYELDLDGLASRTIESVEQELGPHEERELHNAAHHEVHGAVTYLQQVHSGGFSVFVGPPGDLSEHFFGANSYVAFMDDKGPGHGSKVGPDGVQRTLRVLKGHLSV